MNLTKLQIALMSPAFWAMAVTFILAGLSAVVPHLQGTPLMIVMAVIAGLGAIQHPKEVQQAGATRH